MVELLFGILGKEAMILLLEYFDWITMLLQYIWGLRQYIKLLFLLKSLGQAVTMFLPMLGNPQALRWVAIMVLLELGHSRTIMLLLLLTLEHQRALGQNAMMLLLMVGQQKASNQVAADVRRPWGG
ncbi:hypothetical protein AMECASPLE_014489 [Ameca splendens]|uniref:Uncharacterized protein n=1 Tax=Ameca splendens TaxID=208324 RepID=A0ABV0XQG5_9TELE